MAQGGRGKKSCHFPPEGDTIGNAITRKCKLGMLTHITMDISVCPSEWYQSAKFRVLGHALFKFLLPEYDNILFCMLHTAFIILISHDRREPFPMRPTACRVSSPMLFLVLYFFTPTQSTITVLFLDCTGKMNTA